MMYLPNTHRMYDSARTKIVPVIVYLIETIDISGINVQPAR